MNLTIDVAILFILGTLIGSFLNVVIWRLPRDRNLGGRSQCPHCGRVLGPAELLPILSYLLLRRRCRSCRAGISVRYMVVELVTAVLFGASWLVVQPESVLQHVLLFRMLVALSFLVVIFVIDLEHFLILDRIVFPAVLVMVALNILTDSLGSNQIFSTAGHTGGGIIAAAGLSLFFFGLWAASRGRWIGFGDVKFAVLLGLIVGWPYTLVSTMLAFFLGTLVAIPLLMTGTKALRSPVPFGTFLAAAAAISLWFGPQMLEWYLRLIGLRV